MRVSFTAITLQTTYLSNNANVTSADILQVLPFIFIYHSPYYLAHQRQRYQKRSQNQDIL